VASFPLDYPRGILDYGVSGWYAWTDNYLDALVKTQPGWMIYPQPILADIEFDRDGSMIISLMDRLGHQAGDGQLYRPHSKTSLMTYRGLSGGDVIRLAKVKRSYQTEHNGHAGERSSAGESNGEGPAGGEFYSDDAFSFSGTTWHRETATGGLAMLPTGDRLLVSVREPKSFGTGGVKWFDNATGTSSQSFSVLPGNLTPGYFWKTNNVGDIELITDLPFTQVGGRVWLDNNGDGVQDASEPPFPGVEVQLYYRDGLVSTTWSDSLGSYAFNDGNLLGPVRSRADYQIRVPFNQMGDKFALTSKQQGTSRQADNDAVARGGYGLVELTTTNPGEHIEHSDIGFLCNDVPNIAVKATCTENELRISVTGARPGHRYYLIESTDNTGWKTYEAAMPVPKDGLLKSLFLGTGRSYEGTVRVLAPSSCFKDVFISSANHPGCGYVPETLKLKEAGSMAIYPNPSHGRSQLSYRGASMSGKISILVTDIDGKVIKREARKLEQGYYHAEIDLTRQPPGSYLLTIEEDGRSSTKNIIRQ
jgi:hypothetical protein